jgi:hypothetical protein
VAQPPYHKEPSAHITLDPRIKSEDDEGEFLRKNIVSCRVDICTKYMYTYWQMQIEWDSDKAALNANKHGISFELAALVFLDDDRLIAIDDRFDYGE